jgi:lactoylglutathione lyase
MSHSPPSLSLLVLKSPDLEALRSFYIALGLTFEAEQHGKGPLHYSAQLGATLVELYPLGANDVADRTTRLGFRVDDLAKALERLESLDDLISAQPQTTAWGLRAVVHDPDGRAVELYQLENPPA